MLFLPGLKATRETMSPVARFKIPVLQDIPFGGTGINRGIRSLITASIGPSSFTWSARAFVSAMLARSPITAVNAPDFGKRRVRPLSAAAMQHDLVALCDQQLSFHEADTVSRTCDEYSCHRVFFEIPPQPSSL